MKTAILFRLFRSASPRIRQDLVDEFLGETYCTSLGELFLGEQALAPQPSPLLALPRLVSAKFAAIVGGLR